LLNFLNSFPGKSILERMVAIYTCKNKIGIGFLKVIHSWIQISNMVRKKKTNGERSKNDFTSWGSNFEGLVPVDSAWNKVSKHFYFWSYPKYWLRYDQISVRALRSGPIFGTIPGFLLKELFVSTTLTSMANIWCKLLDFFVSFKAKTLKRFSFTQKMV
jgi:hypothetical protein